MKYFAKHELHIEDRHYFSGDEIPESDVNSLMKEMTLVGCENDIYNFVVTLRPNGGVGTETAYNVSGEYVLPAFPFKAPDNQEFKGWSVGNVASEVKPVGATINVESNVDLYAQYKPISVTVSFDANGGSGKMASVKKNKGEAYKLATCSFNPPKGYKFKGWSLDKASVVSSIKADNVVVHALWEAEPDTKK